VHASFSLCLPIFAKDLAYEIARAKKSVSKCIMLIEAIDRDCLSNGTSPAEAPTPAFIRLKPYSV